jgi:16S rRNA (guanine1516-N2)-methyltransferase
VSAWRLVDIDGRPALAPDEGDENPVRIDLVGGRVAWRKQTGANKHDPLVKALGKGKGVVTVVDATAGLGRDACALAAAGFVVTALERSPAMQALWLDALATQGPVDNLTFVPGDSVELLRAWAGTEHAPDAIYLDPMYPEKKKSALAQKEMRALRDVVGADLDVDALLLAALACAKKRVVVKRSVHAVEVNAPGVPKPTHSAVGTSTRFDIYAITRPGP